MKILAIGLSAVAILTISACGTIEMVTVQKVSDQTSIVSATAANSVSIVKASSDGDIVCIRHGPDAIASSGFSLTGGGAGEGSSNSEAEMDGRTPVLLLARDAQFELCNMYLNGVIDKSNYVKMVTAQHDELRNFLTEPLNDESTDVWLKIQSHRFFPFRILLAAPPTLKLRT